MADEEQPSWLSGSNNNNTGGQPQQAPSRSRSTASSGPNPPYKSLVKGIFFVLNVGFMLFMAATGALGIGSSDNVNDSGVIFVGIYMILFAAMVTIYEFSQVCPSDRFDNLIKRNFGFLYGVIGKGLFICFMGVLAFGLSTPRDLAIACGVLVAAWGPFQILIYLKWPEYFDRKEKYNPERD